MWPTHRSQTTNTSHPSVCGLMFGWCSVRRHLVFVSDSSEIFNLLCNGRFLSPHASRLPVCLRTGRESDAASKQSDAIKQK